MESSLVASEWISLSTEQAERCSRLARDCTDPMLRDSLLKLAKEYTGRASAQENDQDEDDQGVA
jgi:hypothetical protein